LIVGKRVQIFCWNKIKYIPANNPLICVYFLGGFSEYVKENAKEWKLITLDDIYN